jgi:hypothetical protein
MQLGGAAFNPITDREAAKRYFASTVGRVEIETHSYCNRRCSYCPNGVGDRLGRLAVSAGLQARGRLLDLHVDLAGPQPKVITKRSM